MCFASQRHSINFQRRVTGRACLGVPGRFLYSPAGLAEKAKPMDALKFLAAGRSGIVFCSTGEAFVDCRIGLASHIDLLFHSMCLGQRG